MIMITAIVTMMVTAIITTVARYVTWQVSVLGAPLYRLIFWHILLFVIVLAIFLESKQGFKKSLNIIGHISRKYQTINRKSKVNYTMNMYRDHAKKFQLRTVLMPIAITLFIAYILSAKLLFFAIVTSGSMEPTFKKGDLVFMQDIFAKPKLGDIIIFQDPERKIVSDRPVTITHRINSITGDTIRTKGDNNPNQDNWKITKKDLLGKAIILNDKPLVLKDIGKYFLLDYKSQEYTAEFLAIATTIQNMRTLGIMIFFVCIGLYLMLSIRESRPNRHFRIK